MKITNMATSKTNIRFTVLVAMIVVSAFSRLVPHMPNFSSLGAIGLFGAAYFSKKWQAFFVPIAATWLSDLFINNVVYVKYYPTFSWFYPGFYWQYGSYLLIVIAGLLILKTVNTKTILTGVLASTVIFFLVSNFGCWLGNIAYPQNFNGLLQCYVAGVPFLKGTFLSDLVYSIILFGGFSWVQNQFPVLKFTTQQVNNLR
jgi:hypothetical protein